MSRVQASIAVYVVHIAEPGGELALCSDIRPARFVDNRAPRQLCEGCRLLSVGGMVKR